MSLDRRSFLSLLAAAAGPWSLHGRRAAAATASMPALEFLTPSEYRYLNRLAPQVAPDSPVLDGTVDVAANLDRFFARHNASADFLIMLRFLRLIRLADPLLPALERLAPLTAADIRSFQRTLIFMGYYGDANGEADLPPEARVVWPRLGYGGPKPDDWWPPESEPQLDPAILPDRLKEEGA